LVDVFELKIDVYGLKTNFPLPLHLAGWFSCNNVYLYWESAWFELWP